MGYDASPHGYRVPRVLFKKLQEGAVIPTRAHDDDAGFDLSAYTTTSGSTPYVTIHPGAHAIISTGIACALPEHTVGLVYVRSSLGFKKHITLSNAVGVVDAGYRGELKVSLHNAGSEPFTVTHGDRIAQIVVTPLVTSLVSVEVDDLPAAERGEQGFGSTGR